MPWSDPAARAFALRAWRASYRGDVAEAERAWRWVERLDHGPWASVHRAQAMDDLGVDSTGAWLEALERDPTSHRARLGLALSTDAPLGDLLERFPCRVASSDHPQRAEAEALCAR